MKIFHAVTALLFAHLLELFAGNLILLMFYTAVSGWLLYYGVITAKGSFASISKEEIPRIFGDLLAGLAGSLGASGTGRLCGLVYGAFLCAGYLFQYARIDGTGIDQIRCEKL